MKNLLMKSGLYLGILLIVISGCNSASKSKDAKGKAASGKETTAKVETFDAMKLKDQIVETIRQVPSEKEVVTLLNESGAAYIFDLTVSAKQVEKLISKSDQSFGLGLYSFDLLYASVYNRGDAATKISDVSKQLIDHLGLSNDLVSSKDYLNRIKANADNKDSLDFLVTKDLEKFHQQMAAGDQPDVYGLWFIGTNVEALYILSQTTLLAQNNAKLLDIMSNQTERVKTVFKMLEILSVDEDIKPYFEQFKPVVQLFEEHQKITEKELAEIGSLMEQFRNNIMN